MCTKGKGRFTSMKHVLKGKYSNVVVTLDSGGFLYSIFAVVFYVWFFASIFT
jgi:hypothetical protein